MVRSSCRSIAFLHTFIVLFALALALPAHAAEPPVPTDCDRWGPALRFSKWVSGNKCVPMTQAEAGIYCGNNRNKVCNEWKTAQQIAPAATPATAARTASTPTLLELQKMEELSDLYVRAGARDDAAIRAWNVIVDGCRGVPGYVRGQCNYEGVERYYVENVESISLPQSPTVVPAQATLPAPALDATRQPATQAQRDREWTYLISEGSDDNIKAELAYDEARRSCKYWNGGTECSNSQLQETWRTNGANISNAVGFTLPTQAPARSTQQVPRTTAPATPARISVESTRGERPTGDTSKMARLSDEDFNQVGYNCVNDPYNNTEELQTNCMMRSVNVRQGGLLPSDATRVLNYIQLQSDITPEIRKLCPPGDARCIAEQTTMLEDQKVNLDWLKEQERIKADEDAFFGRRLKEVCKEGDEACLETPEDEGFGWAFPNASREAARLRESQQKALESGVVPPGYWDPNGPYPRGAEDMYVSPQDTPRNFTQGSFLSDVSKFFSNLFGGTNEKSLEPLYNSKQKYPGNVYKGTPLDAYKAYSDDEFGPSVDAWVQEEDQTRQDAAKAAETEAWLKELEARPQIVPSDFDEYINTEPTGSTQQIFDSFDYYPDEIPDESYIGPSRQYSIAVPFSNELFNQSLAASAFGAFLLKDNNKKDNIPARGAREPYGHGL